MHTIQIVELRSSDECMAFSMLKKVQVGKDQEKAQSEKDSHSKNRGGKKTKPNFALTPDIAFDFQYPVPVNCIF